MLGSHSPRGKSPEAGRCSKTSPTIPAGVRVLELFFAIFESRSPVSHETLSRLAAYRDLSAHAFEVALSRDLAQIEAMGVGIIQATDASNHQIYSIDNESVVSAAGQSLSAEQLIVLHMALEHLDSEDSHWSLLADLALRARSQKVDGPIDAQQSVTSVVALTKTEGLATVLLAIHDSIPVSFSYSSPTETDLRTVEPWRIVLRGHALYLWGFDLDRGAARLFRLNRIQGEVSLMGDPGDCDHVPPENVDPFDDFLVTPVLLVEEGADIPFAWALSEVDPGTVHVDTERIPDGWVLRQGSPDSPFEWRSRLIDSADRCVVLTPIDLRTDVLWRLSCVNRGVNDA